MINGFEEWTASANLVQRSQLDELANTTLAIEAAHYISTRLFGGQPWKEPLLPALGGVPFGMRRLVESDIQAFRDRKITPIFVFHGLDVGRKGDNVFGACEEAVRITANAWELYDKHQAEQAVQTFGSSCTQPMVYQSLIGATDGQTAAIRPEDIFRHLQSILHLNGVTFQVAPYSAWAQLAYLEKDGGDYVDAVAGSSEILLFDVDKVITAWDFEQGDFTWVQRRACMAELGINNADVFVDACLLAGIATHPTLPQLNGPAYMKKLKLKSAVEILNNFGNSGISVCQNYQDDPSFQRLDYLDRYRRSRLAIKHHVVLKAEGKVEPCDVDNAPGDIHEFIGQRLPDELYYYLSKGIVGPEVLNWRASGEILVTPPIDGGDSDTYHKLVREQLDSLRNPAIGLLSRSLNRFYQHRDLAVRCWFDRAPKTLSMRDIDDSTPRLDKWNVRTEHIRELVGKSDSLGIIGVALESLKDPEFVTKSITPRVKEGKPLVTTDELLYNSIWRFLELRKYVDADHRLTKHGEHLSATIAGLGGKRELEEAAVIAVELARLGLLNADHMFPNYQGAPLRGSDTDRRNTLLISRVACLGRFHHKEIGFTGPLTRHILAYHSVISAVRHALRKLSEVALTTLLLNGDADRARDDTADLGIDLPFLHDNDCALGIAVKTYLDELNVAEDADLPESRRAFMQTASQKWFPQAVRFEQDLEAAFHLWDAVYAGVKASANDVISAKEKKVWDEANEWLSKRR